MVLRILCVTAALAAAARVEAATCPVTAQVSARTPTVVLGEPVDLALVVRNPGAAAVDVYLPSERTGNVRVSIADDANPTAFRPYQEPRWGLKDSRRKPVRLEGNGSLPLNLRVLYNGVPNVANPDPSKEIRTPFAFGAAGRFVLRVSYQYNPECRDQPAEATIAIQVAAPAGEDLLVWDRMKDCAACAYLLHTGDFPGDDRASKDAVALFREIAAQHPRSRYAQPIRQVLAKIDDRR